MDEINLDEWRLVDDPLCDLDEWEEVPVDCRDCDLFFDCYEKDN
jgi:hypothetical protein